MSSQHDFESLAVDEEFSAESMQDQTSNDNIPISRSSTSLQVCCSDGPRMSSEYDDDNDDDEFVKEQMLILLSLRSEGPASRDRGNHVQTFSGAVFFHNDVHAPPPRRFYLRFWAGISKRLLKKSPAAEQPKNQLFPSLSVHCEE
jgi:hypothetical protein